MNAQSMFDNSSVTVSLMFTIQLLLPTMFLGLAEDSRDSMENAGNRLVICMNVNSKSQLTC